jgi:triosephosphate isomerase (TIM)
MSALKVIAGNWKMHQGPRATRAFFKRFDLARAHDEGGGEAKEGPGEALAQADGAPGPTEGVRLLIFPPQLSLLAALEARPDTPIIGIGAQNIHWEKEGAYTGEISAEMVAEAGASHVLVGHSERRHVFGETDDEAARKVRAALRAGLTPVLCVGETLEERKGGRVEEVILRQLDTVLDGLDPTAELLVAYEPVWAIGTGETATPDDASAAHGTLRHRLREALGEVRGKSCALLYGGSVKPGNALELLRAEDVDGVLVGGASLDPGSFAAIALHGMAAGGG